MPKKPGKEKDLTPSEYIAKLNKARFNGEPPPKAGPTMRKVFSEMGKLGIEAMQAKYSPEQLSEWAKKAANAMVRSIRAKYTPEQISAMRAAAGRAAKGLNGPKITSTSEKAEYNRIKQRESRARRAAAKDPKKKSG